MKKNLKKRIFLGLVILFGTFIVVFLVLGFEFLPAELSIQRQAEKETFVIQLGISETEVISNLYNKGFIKSKNAFTETLNFKNWKGKINPGGYEISKEMWPWEITDVLVNHPSQKWVFIREGLRKEEIAETLRVSLGWTNQEKYDFLKEAEEGYMWPDTYLFKLNSSGKEMVKRMKNEFNENFQELSKGALETNMRNDTVIILASLIQREAATDEEMPIISGIMWNRLLSDHYLQIDAALQYALGGAGNWWPRVTKQNYKMNSGYNTYIHKGHPPAPICSPGLAAIKSVIYPQETDYFYYIHDAESQVHYAKTYEEHLENIQKYL
ncbi:MAG: endolytic transglycosylase MltG [Candidatus Pacebacteria bacterium]|nr:endolytic transglycosylase MltG [Candidatus Paceibacterota bacterium]